MDWKLAGTAAEDEADVAATTASPAEGLDVTVAVAALDAEEEEGGTTSLLLLAELGMEGLLLE